MTIRSLVTRLAMVISFGIVGLTPTPSARAGNCVQCASMDDEDPCPPTDWGGISCRYRCSGEVCSPCTIELGPCLATAFGLNPL
jgi:hypothetical protein